MPHKSLLDELHKGLVIPAHPLALTESRKLDERSQRALSRYYLAAGAGGLAVGVHTTQFAIRDKAVGLHRPVLKLAAEEMDTADVTRIVPVVRIAGVVGPTSQASQEAHLAADCGYHVGLLSLAALSDADDDALIEHCRHVAQIIPIMGFYLQPAAGGRLLSHNFWQRFAEIENVVAIKIAPFNRYQTLDVVRAVAASGRADDIAVYTGNDDNILVDLITSFTVAGPDGEPVAVGVKGGLLGHWAVWTSRAVHHLSLAHRINQGAVRLNTEHLSLAAQITDANAVVFDAANGFAGCIAGVHEVLVRQGLMKGIWCLDRDEGLSLGQAEELDRVQNAYPHLNDDEFVSQHLDDWLR